MNLDSHCLCPTGSGRSQSYHQPQNNVAFVSGDSLRARSHSWRKRG